MLSWCNQRSIVLTTSVDMGIIYKKVHLRTLVGGIFAKLGSADYKYGGNMETVKLGIDICVFQRATQERLHIVQRGCLYAYL